MSTAAVAVQVSQLRCRYCGEALTLNPDSQEARAAGTDPYQQLRRHVHASHILDIALHARRMGFLLDMMFFDGVNSPDNWRKQIAEMVDFLLKEPV